MYWWSPRAVDRTFWEMLTVSCPRDSLCTFSIIKALRSPAIRTKQNKKTWNFHQATYFSRLFWPQTPSPPPHPNMIYCQSCRPGWHMEILVWIMRTWLTSASRTIPSQTSRIPALSQMCPVSLSLWFLPHPLRIICLMSWCSMLD